jgi:uncharacterized protein
MIASADKQSVKPLHVADHVIQPGTQAVIELPITKLATGSTVSLPVIIVHGAHPGKRLFLTAAVHGDEVNGIAIIQRSLAKVNPTRLCGSILAVPVANVLGFLQETRYLPDRRDLNRSFPGSSSGPLGARLAHLLLQHVIAQCDYGIDLHSGSDHRTNLPHIRADLNDGPTKRLARTFGAPVILHAPKRAGSLREAAVTRGVRTLVYEAGEAHRWSANDIDVGMRGILNIMRASKMLPQKHSAVRSSPYIATTSRWIRASRGGLVTMHARLGDILSEGQSLATIADAFGTGKRIVRANQRGIVIGLSVNPVVHKGDALIHVAWKKR